MSGRTPTSVHVTGVAVAQRAPDRVAVPGAGAAGRTLPADTESAGCGLRSRFVRGSECRVPVVRVNDPSTISSFPLAASGQRADWRERFAGDASLPANAGPLLFKRLAGVSPEVTPQPVFLDRTRRQQRLSAVEEFGPRRIMLSCDRTTRASATSEGATSTWPTSDSDEVR